MSSKIFDCSRSTWSFANLGRDFELEKQMLSSWVFHSMQKIRENNEIGSATKSLVIHTICIIPLYIPILRTITYLAYLVIFPYDLEKSYQKAFEEGNLAGASIFIERGAEGKNRDQNQKTLLDLYLKKFSENKDTKEDLVITAKLWNCGIPFDQNEQGVLPFIKKAILKEGVDYCLMLHNEEQRIQSSLMKELPSQIAFKVQQQEFQKLLSRSPDLLDRYRKELTPSLEGIVDSMGREEKLVKSAMETYTEVTIVGKVASGKAWSPLETLGQSKKEQLVSLESEMGQEILGQEKAIKAVCNRIRLARIGMKESNRPVGVFMCVGPTGVGKTSLAKVIATKVMGGEDKLIRIGMETYTDEHSVNNLIGAPKGYKDHDTSAAWLEALKKNPKSVILLDEIEKAHPKVRQIFLGAFDDGHFVDNNGKKVDCSEAIFVLTSNAGSREILSHGNGREPLKTVVHRALGNEFPPEFINRMDNILIFNKIDNPELAKKIILRELHSFQLMAQKTHGIMLNWTIGLINYLTKEGFNSSMGARPLKRIVEKKLGGIYTKAILRGEISRGDSIVIDVKHGALTISKEKKTL